MLPSGSHCAYICAAITLAINSVSFPSSYCTNQVLISRMGLLLDRPHTWPSASRLRQVNHPFVRLIPRGSINYVLTYVSPTSGVGASSSGGSSAIPSCPYSLSAYRSYTGVVWSSGKSPVLATGPRHATTLAKNCCLFYLCTGLSISSQVKVQRVDLGTNSPLCFNILSHMAGPTSSDVPKYRLSTRLLSGY